MQRTLSGATLALLLLSTASASAKDYSLGPQDRITVKVVEWHASQGTYLEWTPFSGQYTVGPQGTVALPFIGELPAEGKTTAELAAAVATQLQEKLALSNKPDASVEIVEYRPIFILGGVDKPGQYAFQPGLTVLKALTLAGGLYRPADGGGMRLGRDAIQADGEYQVSRLQAERLLAQRARLQAEQSDARTIATPPELQGLPEADGLIRQETEIMAQRREALASQLSALADLKALYEKEAESLAQTVAIADKQIAIAQTELNTVSALVEKGLSVTSRQTSVQRIEADLEAKRLDAQTGEVRAREAVSRAEHDTIDANNNFRARITTELLAAEDDLRQAYAKLRQYKGLVDEATVTTPAQLLTRSRQDGEPTYAIIRRDGDKQVETAVADAASVEPGDVIRVTLPAGTDSDPILGAAAPASANTAPVPLN